MSYKEKLAAHRRAAAAGRNAIREGLRGWKPGEEEAEGGEGRRRNPKGGGSCLNDSIGRKMDCRSDSGAALWR